MRFNDLRSSVNAEEMTTEAVTVNWKISPFFDLLKHPEWPIEPLLSTPILPLIEATPQPPLPIAKDAGVWIIAKSDKL